MNTEIIIHIIYWSTQASLVVLHSLRGSTKSPGTQNQVASELNQLNILQNGTTHPYNKSEGTVLVKNLGVGDEQAVLPTKEHLGMSADGAKGEKGYLMLLIAHLDFSSSSLLTCLTCIYILDCSGGVLHAIHN